MGVTVSTPIYEGPFDLLLDLILREEVELYEVSLATIVDAYLQELEKIEVCDLELATEFLLIASILVELKARRLLPSGRDIDPDDEYGLWEERDLLLARLVECKTFKDAASKLRALSQNAALSWPRRAGLEEAFFSLTPDLLEGVSIDQIHAACLKAMAPRPSLQIDTEHIAPIRATVAEAVKQLVDEIPRRGQITFKKLSQGITNRIDVVVRFLAILELYKQGVLEIDQVESFGDINVSWCHGAELSDTDLVDLYEG